MKILHELWPDTVEPLVGDWKNFLRKQGLFNGTQNDTFDADLFFATKAYQQKRGVKSDGVVGNSTWVKAIADGFQLDNTSMEAFPLKPAFPPIVGNDSRAKIFGKIEYTFSPTTANPERIVITNDFEKKNIVTVNLPQLAKATGGKFGAMRFHKSAAEQLRSLFDAIEKEKMLPLVLTFGGSYVPRMIRGSKTSLSNHSFGTAFDINVAWNGLGKTPARIGQKGCVRELVPLAHEFGFYWGGHFGRADGMHFEVAKIL